MEINELNYAPEIASGMLKKQQAMALVAARHVIVDGATEIAKGAIQIWRAESREWSWQTKGKNSYESVDHVTWWFHAVPTLFYDPPLRYVLKIYSIKLLIQNY